MTSLSLSQSMGSQRVRHIQSGKGGDAEIGRSIQETAVQPWYRVLHREICSVQFGHSVVSNSLQPHELQHTRLPCPSPTPEACSNSCPSLHGTIPLSSSEELKPPVRRPPEARLKEPEKFIKRSPKTRLRDCRPAHTLILSACPPLNHCRRTPHQILTGLGHTVSEAHTHCVLLCLAKQ